jgi:hypothetical protein
MAHRSTVRFRVGAVAAAAIALLAAPGPGRASMLLEAPESVFVWFESSSADLWATADFLDASGGSFAFAVPPSYTALRAVNHPLGWSCALDPAFNPFSAVSRILNLSFPRSVPSGGTRWFRFMFSGGTGDSEIYSLAARPGLGRTATMVVCNIVRQEALSGIADAITLPPGGDSNDSEDDPGGGPGSIDPGGPDDPGVPPMRETPEPSAALGLALAFTAFALRKSIRR